MYDSTDILEEAVSETGWNKSSQISVLLDYINNQQSPEAFKDYIQGRMSEEDILGYEKSKVLIKAECHSDDRVYEVEFDAASWFKKASREEIIALAECGWGNDYPADAVAHFMAEHSEEVADMFGYLERIAEIPSKCDIAGFVCSVNEDDAIGWLINNRRDVINAMGDLAKKL